MGSTTHHTTTTITQVHMIRSCRRLLGPMCARFQAVSSARDGGGGGGGGGGDGGVMIRVLQRNNTFQILRSQSCGLGTGSLPRGAKPLQQLLVGGYRGNCNSPPRPLWPRSSVFHMVWSTVQWSCCRRAVTTTTTTTSSSDNDNGQANTTPPPQPPEPPLVRFYCCFTSHDLEEVLQRRPDYRYSQIETVASFDAPIDDVTEIQTLAQQYFASSRLEYWSADRWKPIDNLAYDDPLLTDYSKALGLEIPVTLAIRDPDQFGSPDVPAPDDNDYDYGNEAFGSSKRASEMENTIVFLAACLKSGGYRRASDTHLYYPQKSNTLSADSITPIATMDSDDDDDDTIATRDWILHHARDDEELRMVLLDYPHALNHIAE
jgi:hypothetical protein